MLRRVTGGLWGPTLQEKHIFDIAKAKQKDLHQCLFSLEIFRLIGENSWFLPNKFGHLRKNIWNHPNGALQLG